MKVISSLANLSSNFYLRMELGLFAALTHAPSCVEHKRALRCTAILGYIKYNYSPKTFNPKAFQKPLYLHKIGYGELPASKARLWIISPTLMRLRVNARSPRVSLKGRRKLVSQPVACCIFLWFCSSYGCRKNLYQRISHAFSVTTRSRSLSS